MASHRPQARGILVALEGIDGTGKSTQARRLAAIFREQGFAVTCLREPTASPWGRRLREAMSADHKRLAPLQELDLFLQDRRYDVSAHIQPALAAGHLVFMDRYYFSTIAYQGARGIDPEHIRALNEAFAPIPDLVFVLLIRPTEALKRIRQGRGQTNDMFEQEEYLKRVDGIFRTLRGPHIHPIDADQPIDVVTAVLQAKVQAVLKTCTGTPPAAAP